MRIQQLSVFNFRNLADRTIEFPHLVNLLVGRNGHGKTNVLEAIMVLSSGRSFRTAHPKELVRWGESACSVHGTVLREGTTVEIGVSISGGKRVGYLSKNPVQSFTEYLGNLVCVGFTPLDLDLIRGAPAERRSFLDRAISDITPGLLRHLVSYQRALKHKLVLLKQFGVSARELSPWNQILAADAAAINEARASFVAEIERRALGYYRQFAAGSPDGDLALQIESRGELLGMREPALFEKFEAAAERELRANAVFYGPHRDDLKITIGTADTRLYASQGQARSAVLSIKLALVELIEARFDESPIILLDDVESELDKQRIHALYELLFAQKRQVFLTGTESIVPEGLRAEDVEVLSVDKGIIGI